MVSLMWLMCEFGFGRRMVFGSEEWREQMRKREEKRNNEGEEREISGIKK